MKIKALTSAVLSGLLRPMLGDVNVVSAPVVAKERGMVVDEVVRAAQSDYESLITVTRHHRAAGALGLRHGLSRRQAAAGRHQGHPGRCRIRQVDDLRHQRGQAGLHRRFREPARRRQDQHRDLPSRPRQAGRRRHRAGRGRRRGARRTCWPRCRRCRRSSRPRRWCSKLPTSFRGGPKDQTRNLGILRCAIAHHSSMRSLSSGRASRGPVGIARNDAGE